MPKDPPAAESDGEDDELLLAASAWASAQAGDGDASDDGVDDGSTDAPAAPDSKIHGASTRGKATNWERVKASASAAKAKATKKPKRAEPEPQQQNYSVHLTGCPYEATQTDIRCAFGERGCHLTSVRLVYDRDQKTGERHFRGVAFVDFADERSYNLALELHNTKFLGKGRRVNVRPTRTKKELSDIVKKTEEKVANLIARSKERAQSKKRGRDEEGENDAAYAHDGGRGKKDRKKRKKRKSSDDAGKKKSADDTNSGEGGASAKQSKRNGAQPSPGKQSKEKAKAKVRHHAKPKTNEDGTPVKLTKKQRAKKAAVIRMMKMKGKKRN